MVSDTRKVYCLGCPWLDMFTVRYDSSGRMYGDDGTRCLHPDNLRDEDTWLSRYRVPRRKPSEINANNDCPWHEEGFAPGEVVEVAKGGIVNYCPRYKEGS